MKKGVRSGPWNGIGSLNSRTRISRLIGALHTGLTQKTVWYTEHAREEGEGSGGREGRQARGGLGGVAKAGGGARGGQPGREVRAVLGSILGPKTAPKRDQKWDHFWDPKAPHLRGPNNAPPKNVPKCSPRDLD